MSTSDHDRLEPIDAHWLARAFELAARGARAARPNPMVGCVVARGTTLLAEGWHERYGAAHAERAALDTLASVPDDATLYVTLEPCAHTGRQPPCTDTIVDRGVRRVVIAGTDPSPHASGAGPARLRAAGVEVVVAGADWQEEAALLNAGFLSRVVRGRPWVTVKIALSANGRMATGDSNQPWVSCAESRTEVHRLRARSGALLVGSGTVLADDPLLTVRGVTDAEDGPPPMRVVLDRRLRMPVTSRLALTARDIPVIVFTSRARAESGVADQLRDLGVTVVALQQEDAPEEVMRLLAAGVAGHDPVNDLLVEAGPTLAMRLAEDGLADVVMAYRSTAELPAELPGIDDRSVLARLLASECAMTSACGSDLRTLVVLSEPVVEPPSTRPGH